MINWSRLMLIAAGLTLGFLGIVFEKSYIPITVVWAALLLED